MTVDFNYKTLFSFSPPCPRRWTPLWTRCSRGRWGRRLGWPAKIIVWFEIFFAPLKYFCLNTHAVARLLRGRGTRVAGPPRAVKLALENIFYQFVQSIAGQNILQMDNVIPSWLWIIIVISGTWIKQKLECAAGGREFGHHLAVASRGSQLGGRGWTLMGLANSWEQQQCKVYSASLLETYFVFELFPSARLFT